MAKRDRPDRDTVVLDRSKGGRSRVAVKGDSGSGNLMMLAKCLDTLKAEVDDRFVGQHQFVELPTVNEAFEDVSLMLQAIADVNEKTAREKLFVVLGHFISLSRQVVEGEDRIKILDLQLSEFANQTVQSSSRQAVRSQAEEFFDLLTEHLQLFYEEFKRLVEEYTEIAGDVEERQNELEQRIESVKEEVESIVSATESKDLRSALFHSRSRLVAFSRKAKDLADQGADTNEYELLGNEFSTVKSDYEWIVEAAQAIKEILDDIKKHQDSIEAKKSEKAAEIKRQIADVRLEIEGKLTVFKDFGKEDLFWGCVYGLHEIMDYVPIDLMAYRVDDDGLIALLEELQKYLDRYQLCCVDFQKVKEGMSNRKPAAFISNGEAAANSREKETVKSGTESKRPQVTLSGDRTEQLVAMSMSVLWGFIRAQLIKRPNDARRGDYGRMPRVIAKLLYEIDVINFAEKKIVRDEIPAMLDANGWVRIGTRRNPKSKQEQKYLYITDAGRVEGVKLENDYLELMKSVVAVREEERLRYEKKLSEKKATN